MSVLRLPACGCMTTDSLLLQHACVSAIYMETCLCNHTHTPTHTRGQRRPCSPRAMQHSMWAETHGIRPKVRSRTHGLPQTPLFCSTCMFNRRNCDKGVFASTIRVLVQSQTSTASTTTTTDSLHRQHTCVCENNQIDPRMHLASTVLIPRYLN